MRPLLGTSSVFVDRWCLFSPDIRSNRDLKINLRGMGVFAKRGKRCGLVIALCPGVMLRGHNLFPVSHEEALLALESTILTVENLLDIPADAWNLSGVDLARNVRVQDVRAHLNYLLSYGRLTRGRTKRAYLAEDDNVSYVRLDMRLKSARAYDKWLELLADSKPSNLMSMAEGIVRMELSLKREQIRQEITTSDDLLQDIRSLFEADVDAIYWKHMRKFDLTAPEEKVRKHDLLMRCQAVCPPKRKALACRLMCFAQLRETHSVAEVCRRLKISIARGMELERLRARLNGP